MYQCLVIKPPGKLPSICFKHITRVQTTRGKHRGRGAFARSSSTRTPAAPVALKVTFRPMGGTES